MLCGSARLLSRRRCFAGVLGWPGGLLYVAFWALVSVSDDSQKLMTGCHLAYLGADWFPGPVGGQGGKGQGLLYFSLTSFWGARETDCGVKP